MWHQHKDRHTDQGGRSQAQGRPAHTREGRRQGAPRPLDGGEERTAFVKEETAGPDSTLGLLNAGHARPPFPRTLSSVLSVSGNQHQQKGKTPSGQRNLESRI